MFTNSTAAQNAAHRADLTWIKVGKSEYMRSDAVSIRKDNMSGQWGVYTATGAIATISGVVPIVAPSLTLAKAAAEGFVS